MGHIVEKENVTYLNSISSMSTNFEDKNSLREAKTNKEIWDKDKKTETKTRIGQKVFEMMNDDSEIIRGLDIQIPLGLDRAGIAGEAR